MSAQDNLGRQFTMLSIPAREIQAGDRLDATGKVRVHAAKMIGDRMMAAHKLRGSKAPGMNSYHPDDMVKVWRKA